MSELETCYKCGDEYYGKAMLGHTNECNGKKKKKKLPTNGPTPIPPNVIRSVDETQSTVYLSHNVMDWFQQEYGENWMKAVSLVLESHVSANKLKEMKIDG